MATVFGHIYTKNNSGQIDKFVPILDSSEIRHDDGNVETVLNNSAKSVETEIESNIENVDLPKNELIFDTINYSGNITIYYAKNNGMIPLYYSYSDDNLRELHTYENFTSSQFQIPSTATGFAINFNIGSIDFSYNKNYAILPNGGPYYFGDNSEITVTNSPYDVDSTVESGSISISELPSVGQSKDFYPTVYYFGNANEEYISEYSGTDLVFTITNVDGTNYTLSFIWEKIENVDVTVKSLKTTVTKNDDTTAEVSNELSGLLQNGNITIEQKLVNAVFNLTSVPAYIEINDTYDTATS